jgi:DNA-binding NarL/FixJ family response regulator
MEALLVDDHAMVRQALKFYLEELDSSVAVNMAENVDVALEFASNAEKLDLIILDYKLPGTVGLAGFEALTAAVPDIPIVFLSGNMHRDDVLLAISAGAAGVIPKDLSAEAMINALRLVLSGEKYLPAIVLPDHDENGAASGRVDEGPLSGLTLRQREVMELLMQGLPNKKIAESLGVEEVTVKLHLSKIFKKLGANNRTDAARIGMGAAA